MRETARHTIPAEKVSSLHWDGDNLVDWIRGGVRYALDGSSSPPLFEDCSHTLEYVAVSDDGQWVALYGGDLLEVYRDGALWCNVEPAPRARGRHWVTFVPLEGRTALVFTTSLTFVVYNLERRTMGNPGIKRVWSKSHSRLQALAHGSTLLSSYYSGYGDMLSLVSLERVFAEDVPLLSDPEEVHLGQSDTEVAIGHKLDESRVMFFSRGKHPNDVGVDIVDDDRETLLMWNRAIGVYCLKQHKIVSYRTTQHEPFDLVPLSSRYLVSYGETLRVYDLQSEAFWEWPEFKNKVGEYGYAPSEAWTSLGTLAVDSVKHRVALWYAGNIHVLTLEPDPNLKLGYRPNWTIPLEVEWAGKV